MKISELQTALQDIADEFGDLEVRLIERNGNYAEEKDMDYPSEYDYDPTTRMIYACKPSDKETIKLCGI